MFSAQAQDTCLNSLCDIPFTKYIAVCSYNNILQNMKMLYYFEIHLMTLQHNVHSKPPVSKCLCAALYCTVLPLTIPVSPKRSFVFIYLTETGTVVGWFLWNVVILLISDCTTADMN